MEEKEQERNLRGLTKMNGPLQNLTDGTETPSSSPPHRTTLIIKSVEALDTKRGAPSKEVLENSEDGEWAHNRVVKDHRSPRSPKGWAGGESIAKC